MNLQFTLVCLVVLCLVMMALKEAWVVMVLLFLIKPSEGQWRSLQELSKLRSNRLVNTGSVSKPALASTGWWYQGSVQSSASQPAQASPALQLQNPVQSSPHVQSHQVIQGPVKPLNWRFPAMPQVPRPQVVHVERSDPVPVRSVAALCTENAVYVEVKKDLFGTGVPIDVSVLTLGGCAAKGEDPALQVLVFESELQGCNSNLLMTEDELVYVFTLLYGSPVQSSSDFIVRSVTAAGTTVVIECHYPRLHNVSSNALFPVWLPYAAMHVAEELLVFTLRLMMDDWVSVRASTLYYLGELINIEASVIQYNHVPLRVYVESCVATTVPDLNAFPRYSFIDNYGCLLDAKLTGSRSRFMPQTQTNKLAFQLETFKFQQANSSVIFIACLLKATAASSVPDSQHKACSFSGNGWTAAYGDNGVCACCDNSCSSSRKGRDLSSNQDVPLERLVTLGPMLVEEDQ